MALINRFSRLFTADLHAVMDRMEEPDLLLKQALREMEAAIAASGQRKRQLDQQRQELTGALERLDQRKGDLEGQLAVCLEAGNDDLARSVIGRRLGCERQMTALAAERERVSRELAGQAEILSRQKAELAELRQKAEVFEVAERGSAADVLGAEVTEAEIEVALLEEKQRRAAT